MRRSLNRLDTRLPFKEETFEETLFWGRTIILFYYYYYYYYYYYIGTPRASLPGSLSFLVGFFLCLRQAQVSETVF